MKEAIEEIALIEIRQKGWTYHKCLGARIASEIDMEFVSKLKLLSAPPNVLWAVPFQMRPSSDAHFETHGIIVAYIDGETHECKFYW